MLRRSRGWVRVVDRLSPWSARHRLSMAVAWSLGAQAVLLLGPRAIRAPTLTSPAAIELPLAALGCWLAALPWWLARPSYGICEAGAAVRLTCVRLTHVSLSLAGSQLAYLIATIVRPDSGAVVMCRDVLMYVASGLALLALGLEPMPVAILEFAVMGTCLLAGSTTAGGQRVWAVVLQPADSLVAAWVTLGCVAAVIGVTVWRSARPWRAPQERWADTTD